MRSQKFAVVFLLLLLGGPCFGQDHSVRMENFWEAGAVLGTPSIFNASIAYRGAAIGGRVSGMWFGTGGAQLGVLYNIGRFPSSTNDIAPVVGLIKLSENRETITYEGLVYDGNFSGFALELGAAFAQHASLPIEPLIQLGYCYQFR